MFLATQAQFWVLAVCVGLFQGGIQALSRSHFAKLIPPEKSGEYFGILDICGKGASFIGTTLVGVVSQITGSTNMGVSVLAVVFAVGFSVPDVCAEDEGVNYPRSRLTNFSSRPRASFKSARE